MQTKSHNNPLVNLFLLFALIVLAVFTAFQIIALWPPEPGVTGRDHFLWYDNLSYEQIMLIQVALGGALGAFIHVATSMSVRIANRTFSYSWLYWYALRPFIGSALALAFYLLVRGGLVIPTPPLHDSVSSDAKELLNYADSLVQRGDTSKALILIEGYRQVSPDKNGGEGAPRIPPINLFGMMAIAMLAGLFSKQAVEKLQELFETMFHAEGDKPKE